MNAGESLAEIERWQPVTNAFTQVFSEEIPAMLDASPPDGALAGVPVAVKELFDVAGHETTGGSAVYEANVAARDAELVTRLRDAGAVIVGKTNMHELAMGGTNVLSAAGRTCNPWDPARITGGSSGGSAAAVASGAVRMAIATDTGGSIRNPSILCGCWGLKPTHGRLPLGGVMPLAPSLDCPGPMAITADELGILWEILSGGRIRPGLADGVNRIGLLGGHFSGRVHPEIRAAVASVADGLAEVGYSITRVEGEGIEHTLPAWVDLVCAEMVEAHPILADNREKLFPRTAEFVAHGMDMTAADRVAAEATKKEVADWFEERLGKADLLLAPSSPYPAPLAEQDEVDVGRGETVDVHLGGTSIFTRPVNMAGLPAVAIPAGRAPGSGLPVGAQLIGPRGSDEVLIEVSRALETFSERFRPQVAPFPG
jgi:aspartyl-tRNA(Asn)/glutamyl-tRNA(Gln) amidotransferase subunit A